MKNAYVVTLKAAGLHRVYNVLSADMDQAIARAKQECGETIPAATVYSCVTVLEDVIV